MDNKPDIVLDEGILPKFGLRIPEIKPVPGCDACFMKLRHNQCRMIRAGISCPCPRGGPLIHESCRPDKPVKASKVIDDILAFYHMVSAHG